jgi:hypothetical protein
MGMECRAPWREYYGPDRTRRDIARPLDHEAATSGALLERPKSSLTLKPRGTSCNCSTNSTA